MGTIERTFAPAVADECQYPIAIEAQECGVKRQPDGLPQVGEERHDGNETAADYFLRQGERDRQDRVIREFLNKGKQ